MTKNAPIVLATDLTARGDRPFERAVSLAKDGARELVLVHAIESGTLAQEREYVDRARRTIARLIRDVELQVNVRLERGTPPDIVARIAAECGAAAIVVGAARFNNIGDFFLGTAVDYLVRRAAMPVLVVKEKPLGRYDRLVVATDFSDLSKHALKVGAELFPVAPIALVHAFGLVMPNRMGVDESREFATHRADEDMDAFFATTDLDSLRARITTRIIEGTVSEAVAETSAGSTDPLVVVGSHGIGRIAQTLLGSRASHLLQAIPSDVLVVRQGAGDA